MMDARFDTTHKISQSIGYFFEQCSTLTTLSLQLHRQHPIMKAVLDIVSTLHSLESLRTSGGDTLVTAGDSKTMIQDGGWEYTNAMDGRHRFSRYQVYPK